MTSFYIHEDDWGRLDIIPRENLKETENNFFEATKFSQEHFDGKSWTNIYLIPQETITILERNIPFSEIKNLFQNILPLAEKVETGYANHREVCSNSFAFGCSYQVAIYGNLRGNLVSSLNLLSNSLSIERLNLLEPLSKVLFALGSKYDLILADWIDCKTINLANFSAIKTYLLGEEEG